jgi:hypothetical protein
VLAFERAELHRAISSADASVGIQTLTFVAVCNTFQEKPDDEQISYA